MIEYNRTVLGKQASELGFIRDTFEKVCRLAGFLAFFERDPVLSRYLALKGGTAINMVLFKNMPRLSVDIDFDFAENLSFNEMNTVRDTISDTIRQYTAMNGYSLGAKSKSYHTLDSDIFQYINSAGVRDNIKVEINYSLRSHILSLTRRPIETLGVFTPATVLVLDSVELYASKIVALLTRTAARDLFDINNMIVFELFDDKQKELLRKCLVFYLAVGTDDTPDVFDFSKLDGLTYHDIKMRLTPTLRKKELFDINTTRERVKKFLFDLLEFADNEKQFLNSFRDGQYNPELLFNGEMLKRVKEHPMAKWKMMNRN
jgi:predicted nucleotidyltransferase component of viral defense system